MAHFQYRMRQPTPPENSAYAYPNEAGIMKPHLDHIGIDIGARITAKIPFLVGDFMVMSGDEFVIVKKEKSAGRYVIRLLRDNRIDLDCTGEEIDARFYVVSGPERPVNHAAAYPLLGKEVLKPSKMPDEEEEEDDDE